MRYLTATSLNACSAATPKLKNFVNMYAILGNQTSCARKVMRDVRELICGEFP
ncbi:MAG: hypothetical protein IPJ46_21175 [Anaerolineales bacterium]|nr:hypothetical protein [Anaerolineales bacterium]